jgi:RND family efflux transporter MFP subunit
MSIPRIAKSIVMNVVLPVVIIGGTFKLVSPLFEKKPTVTTMPAAQTAQTVDAVRIKYLPQVSQVTGRGVAEPAQQLRLSAQVSGRIVSISPNLVVGGRFEKGETLAKIDDRDYRLALRQQSNQLSKAELELQQESARGDVARRELEMLRKLDGDKAATNPGLVTRELQRASAEVAVDAAKSAVEQAELNLTRTVLRAPFAGVVLEESAEVGQVVGPTTMLATLAGSDEIWIRVAVAVEELHWIAVRQDDDHPGSPAFVNQRGRGDQTQTWKGEVVRLIHEVDRESRNAQIIVAVQRPFDTKEGELPLLAGAFVEVTIAGAQPTAVAKISRRSLFEGHFVWEILADGSARKRELNIAWGDEDYVYATAGIDDNALVAAVPLRRGIADTKVVPTILPSPPGPETGAQADSAAVPDSNQSDRAKKG